MGTRSGRRRAVTALLYAGAFGSHVGYPALLAALTRGRARPTPEPPAVWPAVTVVVAAYREAGVIGDKVRSVLDDGYPGAVRVVVIADGDPETAAAARAAGADALCPGRRLGKSAALGVAMTTVRDDIAVLTDANNPLEPGSLAALVRWFADPRVGAVAGAKHDRADAGEGLYWRYENWLKRRESLLGSTVGLVGELYAIRRELWPALPADVANDDLYVVLSLLARDQRVVYEPEARTWETAALRPRDQLRRRTRIMASQFHVLWRWRRLLGPAHPAVAFQLWGHRLWRSSVGPLCHLVLLARAASGARAGRPARVRLAARAVLAAHAAAAATLVAVPRGDGLPARGLRAVRQLALLEVVSVLAWLRVLRRDLPAAWEKTAR